MSLREQVTKIIADRRDTSLSDGNLALLILTAVSDWLDARGTDTDEETAGKAHAAMLILTSK